MKAFLQFFKTLFFKTTLALSILFLLSASSSWGQIAQRGTATTASSATTNNTTITINKPSGVVAGDVLLFSVVQNETDNDNGGLSSPTLSGWTLVKDRLIREDGTGNDQNAWFGSIYYRVSDGSEGTSFTFAMDSRCDMAIGSMVAFSGVACNALRPDGSAGGPFDIVPGAFNNTNTTTATASSVTVANNNAAVIMFAMCMNDRSYSSWSNSQAELFDNITTDGDDASVGAAWLSSVNSGATGTRTVNLSQSDRSSAILLVLRRATTMTVGAASSTPTLCINTALTNITHTTTGATGIGTATGLPAGVTAAWASNTITISGTPTASGTFEYSIPLIGSCAPVNATGTITVTAANTAGSASSTPSLCNNTVLTNITHTTTRATGIGTATGLPAGVTAAWASNTITISGTPTASGTFNYSIPLTGGCGSVNATGTITVSAPPSAGTLSGTQAICSNGTTTLTSSVSGGTWSSGATEIATINASTGVVTGVAAGTATMTYTVTGAGGCANATAIRTVTVTAAPSAGTLSGTQEICANGTTTLTSNVSGGTWSSGSTGIATINASTGVVTGVTAGTATMTYTVTGAGGCANATATRTVTVNFVPTVTNALVCAGGSGSLLVTSSCADLTGQTAGANLPGTGATAGTGTAWSNPTRVTSNDNSNATVSLTAGGLGNSTSTSQLLSATGFGFSIPTNAIIVGITANIGRFTSGTILFGNIVGNIKDATVSLLKGGVVTGSNLGVTDTNWPTSETAAEYGSNSNLWGSSWTVADVNSTNFGIGISTTQNVSLLSTINANIDYVSLTITYTIPGSLLWYTASSGGTLIGSGNTFNPVGVANSGLANTNTAGTTTYWVECTTAAGSCRAKADFIIKPSGTWIGATSTDWNTPQNWCGTTPNAGTDVTIPNEPSNKPIIGSANEGVRSLIIETGAQLTINSSRNLEVSGNWTNNGTFIANSGSSVNFKGGNQVIGGANVSTFSNISITAGTTTLGANVSVTGNLSVTAGTLDLGSFTANRSAAGGTITVAGTLKIGGTNTFPSNYATQTLSSGTVEYNGANQAVPVLGYNNLTFSGTLVKTFASGSSLNMPGTFIINDGTTALIPNETPVRRHDVGVFRTGSTNRPAGVYSGTSVSAPPTYDVNSRSRNVTRIPELGSSTTGVIVMNAAALPVTLTSFTAKPTPDNKVSLAWVTSTEQVNKGFRIERQAGNDNGKFEQIGFVGSKAKDGNSQSTLTYNFIDAAPKFGAASFYRLVQEDLDGKLTYSEVRVVKLNGQSVSMVFPNPSNGAVNISRTADGRKMNIQVIDQSGRIVSQVNNITDANYRINISQSGVYSIKMMYPETGEQSTQRVVVQK